MLKFLYTNLYLSVFIVSLIIVSLVTPGIAYNDAPEAWQIGFQDSASPIFEGMLELFDSVSFYLIVVVIGVLYGLVAIIKKFHYGKSPITHHFSHGTVIELVWTITPALVLLAIAFPSFKLLYLADEVFTPSMTIKACGHQWYWSYEYSDFLNEDGEAIEFDSYMVPESDLADGQLRLLDVDNNVVVPVDTNIRFIVTGQDVIHSFAVPSLGIKVDGIPGRLNQTGTVVEREGLFYGQCSELCGVLHGFMPICIESVSPEKYLEWMDEIA
uniref:cytochrome c oxidase subunit 2 n=1 Tax=Malassezia vespertilionis TaxID=2020962 RepID=UPI003001B80B|nr:cytochrome c oxidase subunit 2 [Malassezia vespertilionis]